MLSNVERDLPINMGGRIQNIENLKIYIGQHFKNFDVNGIGKLAERELGQYFDKIEINSTQGNYYYVNPNPPSQKPQTPNFTPTPRPSSDNIKLYDGISIGTKGGIDKDITSVLKVGDTIYGQFVGVAKDLVDYRDNGVYFKNFIDPKLMTDFQYTVDLIALDKAANLPSGKTVFKYPLNIEGLNKDYMNLKGDIKNIQILNEHDDVFFIHTGVESGGDTARLINIAQNLHHSIDSEFVATTIIDNQMYVLLDNDESTSLSSGDAIITLAGTAEFESPLAAVNFVEIF